MSLVEKSNEIYVKFIKTFMLIFGLMLSKIIVKFSFFRKEMIVPIM